ncbi:MAG: hypothetical protein WED11_06920 [Natronospirillum sp.]
MAVWLSHTSAESGAEGSPTLAQRAPEPAGIGHQPSPAANPAPNPTPSLTPSPAAVRPDPTPSNETPVIDLEQDWLDPYFGLSDPADHDAVAALIALADSLDFDPFWRTVMPLAEQGNDFAVYLTLALRDFMPLSARGLRFGYVEEPYLEQRRRDYRSPNWLQWLFARWQPDWQPTTQQKTEALSRAMVGDAAAQTLMVSQREWLTDLPGMASQKNELQARLAHNPWIQLHSLSNLSARATATEPDNDVTKALLGQLNAARHPLAQWLASALVPAHSSPAQRRAGLLSLAQDGYMTALQEVRLLATTGTGRWTTAADTPMRLRDAVIVYQQLEAEHPDNPIVSVALCELHWQTGDYQASWQYLQKFAYRDTWAEEVEDYSCSQTSPRVYGETLIARGVITAPQWQQHIDTINTRRARIRTLEQPSR